MSVIVVPATYQRMQLANQLPRWGGLVDLDDLPRLPQQRSPKWLLKYNTFAKTAMRQGG
jgi:hypothetical protein